jgi:hypothetical protein
MDRRLAKLRVYCNVDQSRKLEEQTIQWPKENMQKDKQWPAKCPYFRFCVNRRHTDHLYSITNGV